MHSARLTRSFCFAFFCLLAFFADAAGAWEARVVTITDGVTIAVLHEGKLERVRLFGVDCPEPHQAYWKKASRHTSSTVMNKVVSVEEVGKDEYGRTVGIVSIKGKNLNKSLIELGYAQISDKDCNRPECTEWKKLQARAKKNKRGLWAKSGPAAPGDYRRGHQGDGDDMEYHGDVSTHVFHSPNCPQYECKSCIVRFDNRQKAVRAGYNPCELCRP